MPKLDDDVDALFRLPLAEFISARKILVARLKKDGRADEAERVKLLAKPSISAWAVNQLYWQHRQAFDRLIATGQRFHKAQTSGKVADMREALDARREALSQLSDLATTLLRDTGHNPSLDTIRRITTTLEAMSAYASLSDGPTPGRLTQDVDPPGFDSFAGFIPIGSSTSGSKNAEPGADRGPHAGSPRGVVVATGLNPRGRPTGKPAVSASKRSVGVSTKARQHSSEAKRLEASRQAKIAVAKLALQNAKKSLTAARAKVESLEATKKKADVVAKEAEKQRREAEERFKRASAAAEEAADNARSVKLELEEATNALDNAKRNVERETKELESLFRGKL